jgi:hypothetical protein
MQIFNFQQPKFKILQAISFKLKGFCNFSRYVFIFYIIKLMSKKAKVKKEVRGQGERKFTKITKNSLLGIMQRIKIKWKLLLPP